MLQDRPPRHRWPRSQRFSLSEKGVQAEAQYRETIVASRAESGRASFDAARAEWAKSTGVESDDGIYLGEVRGEPRTLNELVDALESCGKSRTDALAALGRLVDAGLIDAPTAAPAPAPSRSPYRY